MLVKYKMKLNPTKFAFEVTFDKFLEFMVTSESFEANPEKIVIICKSRKSFAIISRLVTKLSQ